MDELEKLTKIYVDLPNHWACGGESMWAQPLGDDCYEVRNVPFYTYDLNFGDVVIATADSAELKPEIRRIVRRSGHQTLRIIFTPTVAVATRTAVLENIKELGCDWEGANDSLYSLDLAPGIDMEEIRQYLDSVSEDVLDYETCEAQAMNSFDASPES